jgi:hypothetical protein
MANVASIDSAQRAESIDIKFVHKNLNFKKLKLKVLI